MEISIKDLVRIVKNGIWLMVTVALIFAVVTFGYSKIFIQKKYETKVKLYVETQAIGNNSYNDLSAYNYAVELVNTYIEMLQTNNFYTKVSENLDNKYSSNAIGSMIRFNNDSETEVFSVIITANSPAEAKLVADSVSDVAPGIISTMNDNAKLKIVDNAVMPTAPSSPNVVRNTALALLVGFALAFLYIFLKELLDVKIKYTSDMISIQDIPVLAAIPNFYDTEGISSDYYAQSTRYASYTSYNAEESEGNVDG